MLTANPHAGSTFLGWSGACAGSDMCSVTISQATQLTATFGLAASPTPTDTPTDTPTATPTDTPTDTPSPTNAPMDGTATATISPSPTNAPASTPTATPTSTAQPPTPTATPPSRGSYRKYLPLVEQPGLPDLGSSLSISPAKSTFTAGEAVELQVTITNQGNAPAQGFWVDLYLNPSSPPTSANQIWSDRCGLQPCYGIAWFVPNGLAPGQHITLSSRNVPASYAVWPGYFAAGTTDIYVYADSYNSGVAT